MAAGRTASALVQLTRPLNAVLAAVGVLCGMLLTASAGDMLAAARIGAPLAALFITAAGNVVNDLRDVEVDRQAHPKRPLPSGRITRRAATNLAAALASMGLAAAALAGVWTLLFALATVLLLAAYELRLKRGGLAGNVAVAALTAATFVFGAVASGHAAQGRWAYVAAGMAFFVNLAREVAKDIQDQDADRAHRRTLPMQVGTRTAGNVAAGAAVVGVLASWPFFGAVGPLWLDCQSLGAWAFLSLLAFADAAALAGAVLAPNRAPAAQVALKVSMALAILAFVALILLPPGC